MVLVKMNGSSSPSSDTLLMLLSLKVAEHSIPGIHARFPNVTIWTAEKPWADEEPGSKTPVRDVHGKDTGLTLADAEVWDKVTILLTGSTLPEPEKAPRLRYVQLQSAGANHVLEHRLFHPSEGERRKAPVLCTANGVHGPQISEWVVSTYLAVNHHLPRYLELQKEGRWEKLTAPTEDVYEKRVGILGYGSIGRQTARVCTALGMSVHAYTLHPKSTAPSRRDDGYVPPGLGDPDGSLPAAWFSGSTRAELHSFLQSGLDLLVVCLPLTDSTRGLLGRDEFAVLAEGLREAKRKPFVANIARGPIVDTDALVEALENEVIGGAALDVTDPEPLPEGHALWKARNLVLTPHVSGSSVKYSDRVLAILELNMNRMAENKEFVNRVNFKEGY